MNNIDIARGMIDFIDKSPCSYFAVKESERILRENGFIELNPAEKWEIKADNGYYVKNNDSAIIAFKVGEGEETLFKIVGSHSDSPGFRIKANPMMKKENNIILNTEVYGGAILSTWFDRPLGIAGRVVLSSEDSLNPKVEFVKIDKDLLIIPSLAIHMNREINKGFEFNPQLHTLPLLSLSNEELDKSMLIKIIAEELKVNEEDVIDYDLYLYDRAKGQVIGAEEEMISIGRIDNLGMLYTSLKALVEEECKSGVNMIICTDNEEVGSRSKMGADSPMIENTLERITIALGKNREEFLEILEKSYMISADMAHAAHPNFLEKADPTNRPKMGEGPAIKYAANKAYTSDAISAAIFKNICKDADVPYQTFHNRSDLKGGSTIGPITATRINVKSVDIGGPILSMHSIRELCAVKDIDYLYRVFRELYRK